MKLSVSSLLDPPIWREGRLALEAAALVRDPLFRGEGVADAGGQPILLVPGFLAGDTSLATLTRWLRRSGHHTRKAGIRLNVACSEAALERLEQRLERLAAARGRVAIVGQSRGGCFAKALAVRRPELVSGIVTLGAPVLAPLAVHPLVRLQVLTVGALGTLGAPGLFSRRCRSGDCCTRFALDLAAPLAPELGYTSIYSRSDGIVDWRSCLDPAADHHVEVDATHCGMSLSAEVYRALAAALAGFRRSGGAAPALRAAA